MIRLGPSVPSISDLDSRGRAYLLALVEGELRVSGAVSREFWREAWGRAADYQTAHNARLVLAGVTA